MSTQGHDPDRQSDHLWDPGATPDREVVQLEEALRPLRHRRSAPEVRPSARVSSALRFGGLAAAVLAVAAGVTLVLRTASRPSWEVIPIQGAPSVDSSKFTTTARLKRGEWLETDATSRATVNVANIGTVAVEPGTRLRLVDSREGREHRMELAQGSIHAVISAPPRLFFVDTPSAQAIDMGCRYTLAVAEDRSSYLETTYGLVELVRTIKGRQILSKVPTGAVCRTDPVRGPGTPRFTDAPEALVGALDDFDAGVPGSAARALGAARGRDVMSLWHLLSRTDAPEQRNSVLLAIVGFVGRPAGVSDQQTLALDRAALDAWWSYLAERWSE